MRQRLFVYGSLSPGGPNEQVLAEIGGTWTPASVRGRLRDEGWGSKIGYPGLVLDDGAERVAGVVFSSENLDRSWDRLDAFEGADYARVVTEARLEDLSLVHVFVYVLRTGA